MIPCTPTEVRAVLQERGLRPSKAMGQNFLTDRNILRILLETAELQSNDTVLEIGPGLGVVTKELAGRVSEVLSVEKDHRLYAFLSAAFSEFKNLELRRDDALKLDMEDLVSSKYRKVVANLPYSVGSRILVDLAMISRPAELIVVTVQKEVADRLSASPGVKDFGILSLWVQMVYHVEVVKRISASCFWPRPEVRSAIVRLRRRVEPLLREETKARFYALTRSVFKQRRKQLASLLGHRVSSPSWTTGQWQEVLSDLGVLATVRPEGLAPEQWRDLVQNHVKALRE